MSDDGGAQAEGLAKVTAVCPECGSVVDATYRAAPYLEKLGVWEGIEDCRTCSTVLSFSVELDEAGRARVRFERL